jgi:hypothetical protein
MRSLLGMLLVFLAGACTPPPPVTPPNPDASDASPGPLPPGPSSNACAAACAALQTAHCPEGTAPSCAVTLQHENDDHLVRTPSGAPMTCAGVALVQTPTQARANGIRCDAGAP